MNPPSRAPAIHIRRKGRLGLYAVAMERTCRDVLTSAARDLDLDATNEISLLLCDGPTMRRLNRRWRSKNRPTNVLSFPLNPVRAGRRPPTGALGDIAIALPIARREARRLGTSLQGHAARLLVHGLLHLLGYGHSGPKEAKRMQALEERLLLGAEV